jgi:hypothetical protein
MERFQARLLRDNKILLDGLTGTFTSGERAAGFFAAPPGTSLVAGPNYELELTEGKTLAISIQKVVLNGHRPAIVQFQAL